MENDELINSIKMNECEGMYLKYANLECANLECANLEGANLECANFRFARIGGAKK